MFGTEVGKPRKLRGPASRRNKLGYLFITPHMVVFLVLQFFPLAYTFFLSTIDFSIVEGDAVLTPVGLANYGWLFQDSYFWGACINTGIIWLATFVPMMAITMFAAWALSDTRTLGNKLFRMVYFLPSLIPAVAFSVLIFILTAPSGGIISLLMGIFGMGPLGQRDPNAGRIIIVLIGILQTFGWSTLILLTGIKGLSKEYFEAAAIDGASRSQTFFKITMPLLRSTFLYLSIVSILTGLQCFDVPWTISGGNPDDNISTMLTYLFQRGIILQSGTGFAAATGTILFLISLGLSLLVARILMPKKDQP